MFPRPAATKNKLFQVFLNFPFIFTSQISSITCVLYISSQCTSSAHAQTPTFTAVYQLSGWIKAWFILFDYPDYSVIGMAQEQRCPDNRGSTVYYLSVLPGALPRMIEHETA